MVDKVSFLQALLAQTGLLYQWGGKGFAGDYGRDCSGTVTSAIYVTGGPDLRDTKNAQGLFDASVPVNNTKPGVCAFYGTDAQHVDHVMSCVDETTQVFGAHGGGHLTTSQEVAKAMHAQVGFVSDAHYRPDFLGYRRLPWIEP